MSGTASLESQLTQIGYGIIAGLVIVVAVIIWIAMRDARPRKDDKEER
ncbi:MAG: hypothetical protein QY323_04525 [Patescibacteria group bacterium]|nr:MAG: hypothetical protein QY323_04525 [Patescibacteria group bacterium]